MSGSIGLDVRIPVGGLFTVLGALLTFYGLATRGDAALYARSLSIDVNLWWGLVMLAFGIVLLVVARRGKGHRRPHQAPPGEEPDASGNG